MANGKVICEIIAQQEGFIEQISPSNITDWYGFKNNDKQIARFKAQSLFDKNGNYNFYKGNLNCQEVNFIYIIIIDNDDLYYKRISCEHFSNTKKPVFKTKKPILGEDGDWKHLIIQQDVIEQITITNKVYNRICDRNDNVDKKAIQDLFNQNPKKCYYCGIDKQTIDELNNAAISNSSLPWHHSKGLTKRINRVTLEVDQLNPNGGYVQGNIVWACSWCNNAKTDTFTEIEFKNIACGINQAWNNRLQQIKSTTIISFPWQGQVKCCK